MKKLIIFQALLFFSIGTKCQTWSYSSGGNAFDGKYRTSSIVGGKSGHSEHLIPDLDSKRFRK